MWYTKLGHKDTHTQDHNYCLYLYNLGRAKVKLKANCKERKKSKWNVNQQNNHGATNTQIRTSELYVFWQKLRGSYTYYVCVYGHIEVEISHTNMYIANGSLAW